MDADEPAKAKSARMFYAIEVKRAVLTQNKGLSKIELMKVIKDQYSALSDAKQKKYETLAKKDEKRYAHEVEEYEASLMDFDEEDLEDDSDDEDEDEEEDEPSPKKAKKAAKKSAGKVTDEDSDDDEPLTSTSKDPSDTELKTSVARIIRKTKNLETLTRRKVIDAVKAQYPEADLDTKKQLLREAVQVEVAKRQEEEDSD